MTVSGPKTASKEEFLYEQISLDVECKSNESTLFQKICLFQYFGNFLKIVHCAARGCSAYGLEGRLAG